MSLFWSRPGRALPSRLFARAAGAMWCAVSLVLLSGCEGVNVPSLTATPLDQAAATSAGIRQSPKPASEQYALCEAVQQANAGGETMQQPARSSGGVQAGYDEQTNTITVQRGSEVTLSALSQALERPEV